jgi:hypothetical protein
MADFCKQCSIDMFGEDFGDLAGITTEEDTANNRFVLVICEGCGPTDVDHTGKCVSGNCLRKSSPGHI